MSQLVLKWVVAFKRGKLLPCTEKYLLGEIVVEVSVVLTANYWQVPAVLQVMKNVTKDLMSGEVLAASLLLQTSLLEPTLLPMDSHSSAAQNDHHSVLKNSSDRTAYHPDDILCFETSFIKKYVTAL
jgi:hypothetical protein